MPKTLLASGDQFVLKHQNKVWSLGDLIDVHFDNMEVTTNGIVKYYGYLVVKGSTRIVWNLRMGSAVERLIFGYLGNRIWLHFNKTVVVVPTLNRF
jgi:hypothetical protein